MTKKVAKWMMFFVGIFLLFQSGVAQSFAYHSAPEAVPRIGFYRIPLAPDWLWRVKTDLSDVRIRDEEGQTVPFLVQQNRNEGLSFLPFLILRHTTETAVTTLEVDAGALSGIDQIILVMNNTAVERWASLSESDDRGRWFIIDEALRLTNTPRSAAGQFVQSLHFPFIRYRIFKTSDPEQRIRSSADKRCRCFCCL